MHIGIATIPTEYSIDPAVLAKRAEEMGFESIWAPEQPTLPVETSRPVPREWADIVDPFVMLARASAVTTSIKLGTAVCVVTEHSPLSLAKQVATLDMYSGGRFLFGIGVGSVPEEARILGCDFARRWTQAREAASVMKQLWTEEESEFHGEYYSFPAVYSFPKPVQRPHPPLLLGGNTPKVFQRIVQWADGWIPIGVSVDRVKEGRATLDSLAEAAGRDPAAIQVSVVDLPDDPSVLRLFAEAGADRAIINLPAAPERESLAQMERIARAVLH